MRTYVVWYSSSWLGGTMVVLANNILHAREVAWAEIEKDEYLLSRNKKEDITVQEYFSETPKAWIIDDGDY